MRTRSLTVWLATMLAALAASPLWAAESLRPPSQAAKPNILWITCEDMSAHLGCYGETYANTPHLDQLARDAVRYTHVFATAPVCSPVRSCLITGVYATSLGTQNLRSVFPIPSSVKGYPTYLREAGYYCSNNEKTDYNIAKEPAMIAASWDECSSRAHWRNRRASQPFFSIFNLMVTHQSRTSAWPYEQFEKMINGVLNPRERHDPARVSVPPYYPDTPTVRRNLARYHDCVTAMDKEVGRMLAELAADGLADETIVFFYSDHGMGMPRGKRTLYDSGLHVPLLIRFPQKFQHLAPAAPGQTVDRLVSFVDFPPTLLNLVGITIPAHMQGIAFLGAQPGPPRDCVYGARDRVDEAYDMARSVRDKRYLFIRNYMPHRSWNQPETFSDTAELRQEITRLAAERKLNEAQLGYAGPTKPIEELYDSQADPQQVHNLASSPECSSVLARMRTRHERWVLETRDLGFLPEAEVWARAENSTPFEMAGDERRFPRQRILDAAKLVGRRDAVRDQTALLADADAAVRYWAAVGLRTAGTDARPAASALRHALDDAAASVRIEAAGVLASLGEVESAIPLLAQELNGNQLDSALHAARTLQLLGESARPALPALRSALERARSPQAKAAQHLFLQFSVQTALEKLGK